MQVCAFNRYQNKEGEPAPVLKPLSKKEEDPKSRKVIKGEASSSVPNVERTMYIFFCVRHHQVSLSRPEIKQPVKEAAARRDNKAQLTNSSSLVRSKSTSSLQSSSSSKSAAKQESSPVTIKSLRSLFEPQQVSQNDPKDSPRSSVRPSSHKETSAKKVMNGDVEKTKRPVEMPKAAGPAARPASKLKDDRLSEKVIFRSLRKARVLVL